jgi:hypothetical protein
MQTSESGLMGGKCIVNARRVNWFSTSNLEDITMKQSGWRWPWQKSAEPKAVRPPKIGGTRAPANVQEINFSKLHDFHFRIAYDKSATQVFERCLLIGFTTPMTNDENSPTYEEFAHNRWIVLQREDGRRVYIPRDNLLYIEDSVKDTETET